MTATRPATPRFAAPAASEEAERPALHGARYWIWLFVFLALACFGVVVWQLQRLQIEEYDENYEAIAAKTAGILRYQPRRGTILDTRGRPLAVSVDDLSCAVDPARIREIVHAQLLAAAKRLDKNATEPDPAKVRALTQTTIDELFERLAPLLSLSPTERDELHQRVDSEFQMEKRKDPNDPTIFDIIVRVDDKTGRTYPNRFVWIRRHMTDEQRTALQAGLRETQLEASGARRFAGQLRRQSTQPSHDAEHRERLAREADEFRDAALAADRRWAGVLLVAEERRVYPQGTVAGQVLGFTTTDKRDRLVGIEGVEAQFNSYLTGLEVNRPVWRDARSVRLAADLAPPPEETAGQTLELTLDAVIQRICEEELAAAWPREPSLEHRARLQAAAVVVDPMNGDLLALAHWPPFDPNNPGSDPLNPEITDLIHLAKLRPNRIAANAPEMGSVMKSFTYAAAWESGVLTDHDEPIDCGPLYKWGRVIKDTDLRQKTYKAQGVIWHSSNPGIARIAGRMGPERLQAYLRRFGFGERTGELFQWESRGKLDEVWPADAMGSVPMGYAFQASALQVALGYCVFANGGWLPAPRLVKSVADAEGRLAEVVPPRMRRQVLRRETADAMRLVLRGVMVQGTGRHNNIKEYHLAGKSGTAEVMPTEAERKAGAPAYYKDRNIANFVAIAPYKQPRIVVLVSIQETSQMGGAFSAPVVAGIARRTLEYLMVPHDTPDDYTRQQATIIASR